jgi:hypothetical protein
MDCNWNMKEIKDQAYPFAPSLQCLK